MNKASHHIRLVHTEEHQMSVMGASVLTPIYGRWGKFSVSVFSRRTYYGGSTRISVGFRPATTTDGAGNNQFGTVNGLMFLPYNGRQIEQKVSLPAVCGNILAESYLGGAGEDAGRFVANAVLRQYETLVEHIRQSILRDFSSHVVESLDNRFGRITRDSIAKLLSEIHWKFLLSQIECDERTRDVVEFTLSNNEPQFVGLNGDVSHLQPFKTHGMVYVNHELDRRMNEDRNRLAVESCLRTQAGGVAIDMLLEVLGKDVHDSFLSDYSVTVENNGYKFIMRPNRFISCTDPDGGTAELCIHTAGLSCHPIDEVVLAALNIKYHFAEFMRTAIYHCKKNFVIPKSA